MMKAGLFLPLSYASVLAAKKGCALVSLASLLGKGTPASSALEYFPGFTAGERKRAPLGFGFEGFVGA